MRKDRIKIIQDFSTLIKSSSAEYDIYSKEVNDMDKATQDVLHQLELGEKISIPKWSKELVNVRKRRRYAKDMATLLEPMRNYYLDNKKSIDRLDIIVGEIRKVEKNQKNRIYTPRILEIEIKGDNK